MLTVGIGESITIPARVITEDLLRSRLLLAQAHNQPVSFDGLWPGQTAKILNAYPRVVRGLDEPLVSVSFTDEAVTITGCIHGHAHVEVIDELSAPWSVNGQGGGFEVYVEDQVDRLLRGMKE